MTGLTPRRRDRKRLRVTPSAKMARGKSTIAAALADALRGHGRAVIQASVDGFHRPRSERYRQGSDSAAGYYEDSFDYDALRSNLLLPLGPEGSRRYRWEVFDYRTDSPLDLPFETAPNDAILIADGIFLLRPELIDLWEFRIFVDVSFEIALRRALIRDRDLFGSEEAVRERYIERYFPAQQLYLESARPMERADAIVINGGATPRVLI
ncbi:MAG TPA: uridine kinase [Chloroflexota bacterium]|nr:uridine kinase [Chloroflexota bacterium]